MAISNTKNYIEIDKQANDIKHEVQCLLREQSKDAFESICNLLDKEECIVLSRVDQELYVMEIMSNIQRQEMLVGEDTTVFAGRDLEQVLSVYQTVLFYLRRLEFDFPIELQEEIVAYMFEQELSVICILGILQASPYIYAKEKTMNALYQLFENV